MVYLFQIVKFLNNAKLITLKNNAVPPRNSRHSVRGSQRPNATNVINPIINKA